MEIVLAIAIGVLTACGVWLLLRPRTYPGHHGAVAAGLWRQPVHLQHGPPGRGQRARAHPRRARNPAAYYTDPMPQALVLTAIVIGFAMTALFLVVLLAQRGFWGNDHVDGQGGRMRLSTNDATC
jgi:multicomponent K+:H+ antiporter subunit C